MADVSLDEELLQITEKKTSTVKKPPKKARRDSDEEVSGDDSDDNRNKKKTKPSSESKKPLKKRQKTESDEDVRNGSESSDDDAFNDGYDDDLMGDEEDRERLNQLPELEREAILGERYERRRELREQWETKRRLRNDRRSTREKDKEREKRDRTKKNKEKKGKALSDLKKMRARMTRDDDDEEEEGEERPSKDEDEDYAESKDRDARASSRQDRDRDRDRERERERERREREREREERSSDDEEPDRDTLDNRPVTLEEVNSVRLPRESLIKWLHKPFFNDLVPGFFVRIGIGPDPTTHTNVYRVAQIDSVREGKSSYTLPGADGPTNKVLVLRIATKDKEFKLETISNRSFNEQEFRKWTSEMNKVKKELPTSGWAKSKSRTLRKATDYQYTAEDIEKMLQEKRTQGKLPFKIAAEKARLTALRDAAKETDMAEFVRLSDEINRLEELGKERYDTLNKVSKATTIANINDRNKKQNFATTMAASSKDEGLKNELDPFSRRKTLPRVLLARPKKDDAPLEEEEEKPVTSSNNNNHANNNKPTTPTTTNGIPVKLNTSTDKVTAKGLQDEHSGIDLDISVDLVSAKLDLSTSNPLISIPKQLTTPAAPLPIVNSAASTPIYISPASTATPAASKLSLADYMRRRRALE